MARKRRKQSRTEKGLGNLKWQGKGWYLTVRVNGKQHNHPTGETDLEKAKAERDRFLQSLKAQAAATSTGTTNDSRKYPQEVVTVDELLNDYIAYMHSEKKCKDAQGREDKINLHIRPVWTGRLAASISTDELRQYRANRKTAKASDATINKELGMLRATYIHGHLRHGPKDKKVVELPYFPMVKVTTRRTGFVEVSEYDAIKQQHCASLKMLWMLAYHSGCRSGELKSLEWPQVQFDTGVIELESGNTKNDEGRYLPFYGDMELMLRKQKELAETLTCKYVLFWHPEDQKLGVHCVPGTMIQSCRKLWNAAMKRAGHEGINPHDLRRSAVRNMVQKCGISEGRAMKITGHKTRFMLDYYNIVALGDVQETGIQMGDWMEKARAEAAAKPRPLSPQPEPTKKQRVRDLHEQGRTVQAIAEQLGISVPTVYYHLSDEAQAATIKRNREHKRKQRKLETIEA